MHWDALRYSGDKSNVLYHLGFILPLLLTTLWIKPLTRYFLKQYTRDTNLVWDSAIQSGTGHKSGTRNVYQFSNDCKSNFMTLFTFW